MHKLNLSSMKKLNLLFVALVGALTFGLSSCTDACKDVVCENSGTCVEGVCDCATGYEGELCATEMRAKFIGTYNTTIGVACDSTGSANITDYPVSISNSSAAVTKILVNIGSVIVADVNEDGNTFTIASQTVDGYTYTGTGSVTGSNLSFTINEYDPSYPETCIYTATGTKQ